MGLGIFFKEKISQYAQRIYYLGVSPIPLNVCLSNPRMSVRMQQKQFSWILILFCYNLS